jgi:hypothetical protein
MFLHRSLGPTLVAAVAILVSGCMLNDSSTDTAATTDEEAIQNILSGDMSEYADPDVRWYGDGSGDLSDPPDAVRWQREILSIDRNITIEIDRPGTEAPTAHVSMTAAATGILHLWMGESDLVTHYMKDFEDMASRSMLLKRVHRPSDLVSVHRGWQLLAISGVDVASEGASSQIEWMTIQWGDDVHEVTGVSELMYLEDLLRLPLNTQVTVTVATRNETDLVFLHRRHLRAREQLVQNADGTFSGQFSTGERAGPRHIVIDVLSDGSLNDPEGEYDSVAWGYPFVVGNEIDIAGGDGQ